MLEMMSLSCVYSVSCWEDDSNKSDYPKEWVWVSNMMRWVDLDKGPTTPLGPLRPYKGEQMMPT